VRIIGGSHKGRRILAPGNLPVRPTTDMAKEALFNILNNHYDFEGLMVLDLFAGIGSISYEFASRGAAEVHSIELDARCAAFISQTARKIGLENLFVVRANAFTFLERTGRKFDIIFADPPYDMDGAADIPALVFSRQLLRDEGWLVIEHPAGMDLGCDEHLDQQRKYGKVNFSMFS